LQKYSLYSKNIQQKIIVLFLMIGLLLSLGGTAAASSYSPGEDYALIRVETSTDTEFEALASFVTEFYTQIHTEQDRRAVLMPADGELQTTLTNNGFDFQVLDHNLHEASYYLLYGLPEDLQTAQAEFDFLLLIDSQAVIRANKGDLEKLAGYGIKSMPLVLQEFIAPVSSISRKSAIPQTITQSSLIQEMISQIDSDTLYNYVGNLSGEWAVTIDGSPYTLATRYSLADVPIKKATRYTYEHFRSLGLPTGYDYYDLYGNEKRNVLAQQVGITQPERIILLTAHLDSTSHVNGNPQTLAPGADDNASGSAALMHIAEILNDYEFGCTLRYVLFTGEEQGIYGSKAYAKDVYSQGEAVEAVLNLDMIAYNTPGSNPRIELHTQPGNSSDLDIANMFNQVVSTYDIDLNPRILQDGLTFSDHSSFWKYGIPAILAIEDWSDHTPHYHRTSDRLSTLNMAYYTEFVKASLGTFAHMGCLIESQLTGTVTASNSSAPIAGAQVDVWQDTQLVESIISESDGTYQAILPPGSYTVNFSALDHLSETYNEVQIVSGQTTTLDISMQPCIFVKQVDFTFSPTRPEINQTILLTGTVSGGDIPINYSWDFGDNQIGSGKTISHTFSAKGSYPVQLAANNICNVEGSSLHAINVNTDEFFLPLILSEMDN
jgi:hypothetical protein